MDKVIWDADPNMYLDLATEVLESSVEKEVLSDETLRSQALYEIAWAESAEERQTGIQILNRELPGNILVIEDLGTSNSRKPGYEILRNNLAEILNMDFVGNLPTVYGNGEDICADDPHQNGINYYWYRMFKPNIDVSLLLSAITDGT